MSLWDTRQQAQAALAGELQKEAELLQEAFEIVDECVERLEAIDTLFARVVGLITVKARNLALGSYSVLLDALGQEAGAILRPLVEAIELLRYLRLDPTRVEEALDGRLPTAGAIAKRIDGEFQELREYLNSYASHLSLDLVAVRHLMDFQQLRLRLVQPFRVEVLRKNMHVLFAFLLFAAIEAVNCLAMAQGEVDLDLADRVDALRNRGASFIVDPLKEG